MAGAAHISKISMIICIIILSSALFLSGCPSSKELSKENTIETGQTDPQTKEAQDMAKSTESQLSQGEIELTTEDGVKLRGTYKDSGEYAVILLHQMNRNRHDYDQFSRELNHAGYSTLAIDFRGHGESQLKWRDFDKSSTEKNDFVKMEKDAKAAKDFLTAKGKKIFAVIGASIAANIALIYGSHDKSIKTVVLLSPGMDYHNVRPAESAGNYQGTVLLVSAKSDDYSYGSVKELAKMINGRHVEIFYDGDRHGTDMFAGTDLNKKILKWLEENK